MPRVGWAFGRPKRISIFGELSSIESRGRTRGRAPAIVIERFGCVGTAEMKVNREIIEKTGQPRFAKIRNWLAVHLMCESRRNLQTRRWDGLEFRRFFFFYEKSRIGRISSNPELHMTIDRRWRSPSGLLDSTKKPPWTLRLLNEYTCLFQTRSTAMFRI